MLDSIFDRLTRLLSVSLRGYTSDTVDVTIDSKNSMRFGDFMERVPSSSMFAIFSAEQWESYGLIVIDSALSYALVDVILGGQNGSKVSAKVPENRPHTQIEKDLIEKILNVTLQDFSEAFSQVCEIDFKLERMEISSSFAGIARHSNAAIITRYHIDLSPERRGNLDIVFPYSSLDSVQGKLSQQFMGESFGKDTIWEDHLVSKIKATDIIVDAIFKEKDFPLGEIMNLKKGSTLVFPHTAGTPFRVRLQCDNTPLFEGEMGKDGSQMAVKVTERLIPPEDALLSSDDFSSIGLAPGDDPSMKNTVPPSSNNPS
ncbi:FliM/FliN family flagellar motor switch protein [Acetobacter persici]|uniref:Flagellar motor switch protein FliM n=1 Tax=Acetobacter persici TaxID=1076596 RepID=A0A1U9LIU9_9PROT|nr:FliM/FliN family flagellar motor switch protein [Acetobacter persici]AQT06352.1 hypothetical protein A0U91_15150 [Acetobacter persici]